MCSWTSPPLQLAADSFPGNANQRVRFPRVWLDRLVAIVHVDVAEGCEACRLAPAKLLVHPFKHFGPQAVAVVLGDKKCLRQRRRATLLAGGGFYSPSVSHSRPIFTSSRDCDKETAIWDSVAWSCDRKRLGEVLHRQSKDCWATNTWLDRSSNVWRGRALWNKIRTAT